jgi:sugar transferase (PEP-CTERM/EpsH1 system associated)
MRWLYQVEGGRVRKLEKDLVQRADAVTVVSTAEAEVLRRFCPSASVQVVSNGVDLEHFERTACADASNHDETSKSANHECVFIGALDYLPNVDGVTWFATEVWPEIVSRFPRARFVVVGRRPVSAVRKLARLTGIDVIGEVEDVRPYLNRASLVLVPLRIARGIQNKVLEALAAGKPVIASPQALEGLHVHQAIHLYQAATQIQWKSHISALLTNESERRRLAVAGQAFVRRNHEWERCFEPLARCLEAPQSGQANSMALASLASGSTIESDNKDLRSEAVASPYSTSYEVGAAFFGQHRESTHSDL